jgi:hypothetical protein
LIIIINKYNNLIYLLDKIIIIIIKISLFVDLFDFYLKIVDILTILGIIINIIINAGGIIVELVDEINISI